MTDAALACPETEATVLHAWCTDPAFARAYQLDPGQFLDPRHRLIAEALASLETAAHDETQLLAALRERGHLERIGGPQAVFRVTHLAPAYGDPWPHVQRLAEYASLRMLTDALERAAAVGRTRCDLAETVGAVQEALRLSQGGIGGRAESVQAILGAAAAVALEGKGHPRIPIGIPDFDDNTGGFRLGFCAVLGAPTSWGKSSFAVMCADEALQRHHRPLLVTFEDSRELYGRRLLARRANVNAFRLREGLLDDRERQRIHEVVDRGERQPFYLDGRGRPAERVASDVRSLCASDGCDFVLVDYLQAASPAKHTQDRRTEVTYVARVFTDAIKASGAAGLLFSQLRRPAKGGERPSKHDLKESGDVENAAEMVMIGYTTPERDLRLSVEKCKDGLCGEYALNWNGATCAFTGGQSVADGGEL